MSNPPELAEDVLNKTPTPGPGLGRICLRVFLSLAIGAAIWFGVLFWSSSRQRAAVDAVHALGGTVMYDVQFSADGSYNSKSEPNWRERLLGSASVVRVSLKKNVDDRALRGLMPHLQSLEKLEMMMFFGSRITDRGLEQLQRLTTLRAAKLAGVGVTENGAQRLRKSLPNCRVLLLNGEPSWMTHPPTLPGRGPEVQD